MKKRQDCLSSHRYRSPINTDNSALRAANPRSSIKFQESIKDIQSQMSPANQSPMNVRLSARIKPKIRRSANNVKKNKESNILENILSETDMLEMKMSPDRKQSQ